MARALYDCIRFDKTETKENCLRKNLTFFIQAPISYRVHK